MPVRGAALTTPAGVIAGDGNLGWAAPVGDRTDAAPGGCLVRAIRAVRQDIVVGLPPVPARGLCLAYERLHPTEQE